MASTGISSSRSSTPIYDERCFLPIHVYDTERSRPVAVVLRPGKTPSSVEVARSSALARAPYPSTLDEDAHYLPRRWPLRPAKGDGMVRGQSSRLYQRLCCLTHRGLNEASTAAWVSGAILEGSDSLLVQALGTRGRMCAGGLASWGRMLQQG